MVATFAAIEGIATRALWAEVTDDKRLGLIFAVVFAIVFTASVHVLATWLWGLAADFDRLRGVTMAIVVAMLVCAGGLLLVAGFERDKILIANLDKERAQLELRRGGSAAGQSLITGSIPATDPAARGGAGAAPSSSPAAPAAGSAPATGGLLGALGASPAPGAATGGQAAPGAVPGAGSGGLAGAVPGATTPAVPRASRTTVDSEDDVSFRFVIWLNMLVLLAMLLFTRGRTLGGGYRRARRRVERLEKRDGKVRKQLAGAEAKRHDTSAKVDYCQRVLFPDRAAVRLGGGAPRPALRRPDRAVGLGCRARPRRCRPGVRPRRSPGDPDRAAPDGADHADGSHHQPAQRAVHVPRRRRRAGRRARRRARAGAGVAVRATRRQ